MVKQSPMRVVDHDVIGLGVNDASENVELNPADSILVNDDYNRLRNLPKLDGRPIIGDIPELDPTVPDWAKSPTKPEYTAEDVGAVAEKDIEAFTPSDLEIMWDAIE